MDESVTSRYDPKIREPPQQPEPPQQQPESIRRPDASQLLRPPHPPVPERFSFKIKPTDDLISYPVEFVSWPERCIKGFFPPLVKRPTGRRGASILPRSIDDISDLAMFQVQHLVFSLFDMERKTKDRSLRFLVTTKKPYMPLSARKAPNLKDGAVSRICQGLSSGGWGRRSISIIGRLLIAYQGPDPPGRICGVSETPILVFVDLDQAEKNVFLAIPEAYETAWDALKNGGAHEPHHRKNGGFPQYDEYLPNPLRRGWAERAASNIKELERVRGLPDGGVRKLMDAACFSDLGPDAERQPDIGYSLVDLGPYARLPAIRRLQEGEPKIWMKLIRPYPLEEKWRLSFVNIYTLPKEFQAPNEDEITVMYHTLMERVPPPPSRGRTA